MSRTHSLCALLLTGALIQAACQPIVAPPAPSNAPGTTAATAKAAQVSAIFTLPDLLLAEVQNAALPSSITNDRQVLLGGIGSDLWRASGAPADEFWMVTDRGPNGQIEVNDKNRRTFPVPEFTPHILQVKTAGEALTVQQAIPILTQSGQPVTGLSNLADFTEQGWDYSAQEKLAFNPNGLDSEGLVRTTAGEFWLVDEYSPSLIHVGADGRVLKRYVPAGLDYSGADHPVDATLPGIYSLRQNNRGFEGLGLSSDESTLYLALQSPLSNPDKDTAEVSANTRILVFDIASETVTGEYAYVFDDPAGYGEEGAPDEMKLSGVVALSATQLLILERTDKVAKLYTVDLAQATNILNTPWDDPATSPSLEATTDLASAGVVALPKQLLIDLSQLPETPEKIEGIAVIDKQTIAIANDNDFNLGEFDAAGNNSNPPGIASQLLIITLAQPLP